MTNAESFRSIEMRSATRKRHSEATRDCILAAAREVLAQDGKEGLSVTQVARRAGVNRTTAYGFFPTREHLIEAVGAFWVSDELCRAVFGLNAQGRHISVEQVTERLVRFAMENPELGRIWLFELLSSQRPAKDRFWRQYLSHLQEFAKSDLARPGLDAEVQSVLMLAATFLWPLWVHPRATAEARREMAERFVREVRRNAVHGNVRPEKYPDLDSQVSKSNEDS